MKYKLFTAADPSDSKIIGVADTVNVLPEINKQGQLCWRSRPGLSGGGGGAGEGWDLSVDGGGGGGGHSCLYDGTVFAGVEGFPVWDTVNNVDGIYICEPGSRYPNLPPESMIEAALVPGTLRTCYFIYKVVGFADPEPVCGPSIGVYVTGTGLRIFDLPLIDESTLVYLNVGSDTDSILFATYWVAYDCEPFVPSEGVVTIECFKIVDRDWVTAGEQEKVYYV
jgi:hypothetical protein